MLRDATIAQSDEESRYVPVSAAPALQVGDLLVRKFHRSTDRGNLVVASIEDENLPAVADQTLIALRPRRSLAPAHRRLLLLFLGSPTMSRLVQATTHSSGVHVSLAGLLDVVTPEPDSALSGAVDDLAAASQQFESWSARAQQLLYSVFESGSPKEARALLIEEGRDIRLKVEAGTLIDDFDARVRTRFPYPLAYRWRTVEALASGQDLRATHEAVLETFEVLLCYGAMLAHVMASNAGVTLGATTSIRQKLASRSGPGLGDWLAVLDEMATSKAVARLPEDQPLGELRRLLAPRDRRTAPPRGPTPGAGSSAAGYTRAVLLDGGRGTSGPSDVVRPSSLPHRPAAPPSGRSRARHHRGYDLGLLSTTDGRPPRRSVPDDVVVTLRPGERQPVRDGCRRWSCTCSVHS